MPNFSIFHIFQLDSRVLEEYEIINEVLYIDTIENKSRAHVKFAFRRRIEYHITNTFTQVKGKSYLPNYLNYITKSEI